MTSEAVGVFQACCHGRISRFTLNANAVCSGAQTVGVVKIADFGARARAELQRCVALPCLASPSLPRQFTAGCCFRSAGLSKTLAIQSSTSKSGAMGELDAQGQPLDSDRCDPDRTRSACCGSVRGVSQLASAVGGK